MTARQRDPIVVQGLGVHCRHDSDKVQPGSNMTPPARRPQPVKLVDVARQAGVSLATASRALSSPQLVRDNTLKKVRAAVSALGYVPHGAARALASQRTRTIGAVFPPIDNPIFATGTRALSEELNSAGYTLLLATHLYDELGELDAVRRLLERGVDGMVLVGLQHHPEIFELLEQSGVPYELTWLADPGSVHYNVGVDHRRASGAITSHLASLGHREFAVIAGTVTTNDRARDRLLGVRDALREEKIGLPEDRIEYAEFALINGRQSLARLLARAPGFTALICANDVLAIGAIQECRIREIVVPGQLSVVGFDDIEMAAAVTPALSTVRLPSDDIGRCAGRRLLDRLAGHEVPVSERLPTELIFRDTVAPR